VGRVLGESGTPQMHQARRQRGYHPTGTNRLLHNIALALSKFTTQQCSFRAERLVHDGEAELPTVDNQISCFEEQDWADTRNDCFAGRSQVSRL